MLLYCNLRRIIREPHSNADPGSGRVLNSGLATRGYCLGGYGFLSPPFPSPVLYLLRFGQLLCPGTSLFVAPGAPVPSWLQKKSIISINPVPRLTEFPPQRSSRLSDRFLATSNHRQPANIHDNNRGLRLYKLD